MKNIISAFTTLFFYLLCVFGAAALLTADGSGKGIQSGCDSRN